MKLSWNNQGEIMTAWMPGDEFRSIIRKLLESRENRLASNFEVILQMTDHDVILGFDNETNRKPIQDHNGRKKA